MSDSVARDSGLLQPRKLAIQVVGFLIGLGLLAWCIRSASQQGGWDRLAHANPWLVAAMLGCSIASTMCNGAMFWITIRSLRPVRFWDYQWLNVTCSMLNYAPIRLGAIGRVLYHSRVDRLGLLLIGAWFMLIAYTLAIGIGACLLATLIHESIDAIWVAIVMAQIILGGVLTRVFVGNPLVARYGQGVHEILADRTAIWGALVVRLLDITAFTGRMWIAVIILDIELRPAHVVVLAVVALASSLIPFGRLGFREFCVALTARRLSMLESDIAANMEQLALVDSAAEALIFLPLGAFGLLWLRKRWRAAADAPPPEPSDDRR